jgi:hypothetical protein
MDRQCANENVQVTLNDGRRETMRLTNKMAATPIDSLLNIDSPQT